jgi:predicted 2-oxoglutarate/Fe(II)-dependent dioxygenase YbiX
LQVLRYKPGTFYHPHHDTITDQIRMWSGPRMFTAFIYFNDKPSGGGETEFTHIHPTLKVKPVTGRMILWPSQLDSDSLIPDDRTTHQACNVTSGQKESANLWVHLYDYQTPSYMGCAG